MLSRREFLHTAGAAGIAAGLASSPVQAQPAARSLTVTTTGIIASPNPYAHSSSHLYSIWQQVYGSVCRFNFKEGRYEGVLTESWSNAEPTRWRFKLRTDLKRHDGGPGPTAKDVVHSWRRVMTDPASQQAFIFSEVDRVEAVDDTTFDIVTKRPVAQLLSYLTDFFSVSSADLFEKHGAAADKQAPYGWGPYMLERFDVDQRVVVKRSPHWPGLAANAPDIAIFQMMLEPEQRVTALLNNEVQIARVIPPQLVDRLKGAAGVRTVVAGAQEFMFLAMNSKHKPWDDVRVRRAAAHAVNRDLIIDKLLFGLADRMDGAVNKHQNCYAPARNALQYDPKKAKALLAEAGYANGVDIDLYTAVGRYISDRQVAEAVAQMLGRVGFRVKLHTPEYANFTQDIRAGKLPMFYTGRAAKSDVVEALTQLFETGVTKRIGYSSKELDGHFDKLRSEFQPEAQCGLLHQASEHLASEVPALFMWTHKVVQAMRANVDWTPDAGGEVWLPDVRMS